MLLSAAQVSSLLNALGLTQSIFKPIPDLVASLTAPVDGVVDTVDGIAAGLGLPALTSLPIIGSLLDAENPSAPNDAPAVGGSPQNLGVQGSCDVRPYNPQAVLSQTFPPFDQAKASVFRYRQQQSVNLGSWFVHEQWMTPSLFTCASGPQSAEIDIASGWGNTTAARALLEHHWDTFINQSDFEYLSSIGINTVRLPIGYWSLGPLYCQGTPFEPFAEVYTDSWSRIVRAINWAGEAGIGVLVDLHGAPGSQNGQPHSGISDGQVNFFNNQTYMDKTIDILTFLTQQLASVTNVIGIEILNEPNDDPKLPDFYTRAITIMRQVSTEAASLPIYIHDAFNLGHYSDFASNRSDFIVEDHHSYFVFTSQDASRDASQESEVVQDTVFIQLSAASQKQRRNLVVGEWSCALMANSLNDEKNPLLARQQFCQGQEQVYANSTAGWHFWSYMKEGCDGDLDWCFKNAVGNTLPETFFSYNSTPMVSPSKTMAVARAVAEMELPSMVEVLSLANQSSSASEEYSSSMTVSTDTQATGTDSPVMTCVSSDASPTPSQGSSKRSLKAYNHRFSAVHSRRSFLSDITRHKRDSVVSPTNPELTAAERAITKGYSDGFLTAKIFAQYGMSKLGFSGQYVSDSIATLGPNIIAHGTENYYTAWFNRGLTDAQAFIGSAVNS